MFQRLCPPLVFGCTLASVFAFLYVLLRLETHSLMIGLLALFVVVSALMVITQAVNWSTIGHGEAQAESPTSR
jgi:inner membrane protein